jgi:hypothetical protein
LWLLWRSAHCVAVYGIDEKGGFQFIQEMTGPFPAFAAFDVVSSGNAQTLPEHYLLSLVDFNCFGNAL